MAGQLNIKLLVASVHNLKALLIFFDFICLFPDSCKFLALGSILIMLFCRKKFPVNVAISILQAFNCLCVEILHMTYIFSLYFKTKKQWNKGMSYFYSGNSDNCVLLDINLYETKREK